MRESDISIKVRIICIVASFVFITFLVSAQTKSPRHYTKKDWAAIIDATWGEGLPTVQKLAIFDKALDTLDQSFGAFFNVEINLDSIRDLYRTEIENGVSRGRFAAIMNYISLYMKDTHTMLMDMPVNWGTSIQPGVPLFVIGGFRSNAHFGACLTPLPDSSLLVYRALGNHRLGLEPGDIVLGYDRIPWKTLSKEIMDAQLPIYPTWVWGSTDASITHQVLMSAGMNWHLFDTIDIVKYATGNTVHLATLPLTQQTGFIWGNEQLPIPGIEQPDFVNEDYVKWGIIEGTDIGYLYIASYDMDPQYAIHDKIYQAVQDFMFTWETSGFIIDYRINYGGSIDPYFRIYKLLFDQTISTIGYDERTDPDDHYGMTPSPWATPYWLRIPGNPNSYYDKPIAILTGPGTVSCGDVESVRMSFHPMVRFFGKPSSGALTISRYPDLGHPDWFFYLAYGSAYLVSDHTYLCHTGVSVDEEVWLTQQGVVNETDDVVKAAINWIKSLSDIDEEDNFVPDPSLQAFPNPFLTSVTIAFTLHYNSHVNLIITNSSGNTIVTLIDKFQKQGMQSIVWDGRNNSGDPVTPGVYCTILNCDGITNTTKIVKIE